MTGSPLETEAVSLDVSEWINSDPISLESLRGRVVVVETFQMLCPGCISHGLPLAQRIHRAFDPTEVLVLGLHTVFEHHAVMGRDALAVFLSEYRIDFPVAIDRPVDGDPVPATMRRLALRGTPSMLVIDRAGRLRRVFFGQVEELVIGTLLGRLLAEPVVSTTPGSDPSPADVSAGAACRIDGTCS